MRRIAEEDERRSRETFESSYFDHETSAKIIFIGSCAVGKTSLITKYTNAKITENYDPTLAATFTTKIVNTPFGERNLNMWDTSGCETYAALLPIIQRESQFIVLTFSLTDRTTYDAIPMLLKTIMNDKSENTKICLVGTKKDLEEERAISREEAEAMVREKGFSFYAETSMYDDESVNDVFERIVEIINEIVVTSNVSRMKYEHRL